MNYSAKDTLMTRRQELVGFENVKGIVTETVNVALVWYAIKDLMETGLGSRDAKENPEKVGTTA